MSILVKSQIEKLLKAEKMEDRLVLMPLLEAGQVGDVSIDLRVGTDFLVSHQGREAFIDTTNTGILSRPIKSFFTSTRRQVGEDFLFHPNQTVLFSTLEYLKLPKNIYGELSARSSFSRLGFNLSTIIQPGYCGCVSVEVLYSGQTPVLIKSGIPFLQLRLYQIEGGADYFNRSRKYVCQVRPIASKANEDNDLEKLRTLL